MSSVKVSMLAVGDVDELPLTAEQMRASGI
jgi:hypothetical protein